MNIIEKLKAGKIFITILLALAGIGIVAFYIRCDTSCTYLKGDIFGIDLKHIGIGYMLAIIALAVFRQPAYVRTLLAAGIGVEIYLVAYQFIKGVFCPFCLSFGAILLIAFVLNYEKPVAVNKRPLTKIIYAFGDVALFPLSGRRIPLLLVVFLGYLLVMLTFSGSTTPAYAAEKSLLPSYGSGPYELIVFTDYFCPPCQALESDMDPALNEILSTGGVKVIFIDLPVHKETYLFAKYFLYIAATTHHYRDILKARTVLFSLAKNQAIKDDDGLSKALSTQGIAFKPCDLKEVYLALNQIIKTHAVTRTPTCIVKYSDTDIRKYSGANEIKNGLAMLRATQISNAKTK
jgi:thiol-disulfide isomerase/thioredoxin/uncharacterized membrane protein